MIDALVMLTTSLSAVITGPPWLQQINN